jgi:hypothetical protein
MAAIIRTIKDTVEEDDAATPAAPDLKESESFDNGKLGEKMTMTELNSSATCQSDMRGPVLGAGLRS